MNPKTLPILAATLLLCLVPGSLKAAAAQPARGALPSASRTAATAGQTAGHTTDVRLAAPIAIPQLVRSYQQPTSDYSAGHRGVDYRVSSDQEVVSPATGTVWFAGTIVNRSVVSVRLPNGDLAEVEPVCPSLAAGQVVLIGQPIGQVCASAPSYRQHCEGMQCLHFSYRTEAGYLSPVWVMGQLSPSRLAPWTDL